MPNLKTAQDLGRSIRARRREIGWDQACLARQIGVSRQWVIDIEKGKPRAELELVLRAINVLGMTLFVSAPTHDTNLAVGAVDSSSDALPGSADIDAIVERSKQSGESVTADRLRSSRSAKRAVADRRAE